MQKRERWTEPQINKVMEYIKRGFIDKDIAVQMRDMRPGVTRSQIMGLRKRRGLWKSKLGSRPGPKPTVKVGAEPKVYLPTEDAKCSDKLLRTLTKAHLLMRRERVNEITIFSNGHVNVQWYHEVKLDLGGKV